MVLSRRAAEAAAIEQGKERLQLALDAAELGVWEWDTASCRLTAGEGFQAIFGGEREPINQPWAAFLARVHPEDRAAVQETMEEAVAFGRS